MCCTNSNIMYCNRRSTDVNRPFKPPQRISKPQQKDQKCDYEYDFSECPLLREYLAKVCSKIFRIVDDSKLYDFIKLVGCETDLTIIIFSNKLERNPQKHFFVTRNWTRESIKGSTNCSTPTKFAQLYWDFYRSCQRLL